MTSTARQLRAKILRRNRYATLIRELDTEIATDSRTYWQEQGYSVLPRPERLHQALGI
jgi:hypothetical protein